MNLSKRGIESVKGVFQAIVTFFVILSFIFLAILTGISLLSNSAYKKLLKTPQPPKKY